MNIFKNLLSLTLKPKELIHIVRCSYSVSKPIFGIKISGEQLVIVCDQRTLIYHLPTASLFHAIEDLNPIGAVPADGAAPFDFVNGLLAYPHGGASGGAVHIFDARRACSGPVVAAHANRIARMALSVDASLLATASVVGTIVGVFRTSGAGEKIFDFRLTYVRRTVVDEITFSPGGGLLAVATSRNVQIFSLEKKEAVVKPASPLYWSSVGWIASLARPFIPTAVDRLWRQETAVETIPLREKIDPPMRVVFKRQDGDKLHLLIASKHGSVYVYKVKVDPDDVKCLYLERLPISHDSY